MGREVKRVPLDFDYPRGKVWFGYQIEFCKEEYSDGCERCREFARIMGIPMITYGDVEQPCPAFRKFYNVDPPRGEGFQLWGTTTEGGTVKPCFQDGGRAGRMVRSERNGFRGLPGNKNGMVTHDRKQLLHYWNGKRPVLLKTAWTRRE